MSSCRCARCSATCSRAAVVGRGRGPTVRVADGEPGDELQVDFGRLGFLVTATGGGCVGVDLHRLLSRHCFVWLTHRQTVADVIDGFEAAWAFFGGVFRTVIPDNMKAIVDGADPLEPRLNQAFVEYAQRAGSVSTRPVSAAHRTSHGWSGPCRSCATRSGPARRSSISADAQRRAEQWCAIGPGAGPRHDPVPPRRAVPAGGAAAAVPGAGRAL